MISELVMAKQRFIQLENSRYEVLISLYGAQVLAFEQKNSARDWLWLSQAKPLAVGSAVRGGIPICWPNFGLDTHGKLPKHGFARLQNWSYKGELEDAAAQSVAVSFRLRDNDFSRKYWAYAFELELAVRLSLEGLELELTTTNNDVQSFTYSQALHPYFAISDLKNIAVEGLSGASYENILTGQEALWPSSASYDQPLEAVFRQHDGALELKDVQGGGRLTLAKAGAQDWVMWNPHLEGGKLISDLNAQDYRQFICLEPAQVAPIELEPGEQHTMRMVMRC